MLNSKLSKLQPVIKDILRSSATLQASAITLDIVSYQIADYMVGHYIIADKKPWYGIDIDAKIKELKQELAIAYSYKKKEKSCQNSISTGPGTTKKQLTLW